MELVYIINRSQLDSHFEGLVDFLLSIEQLKRTDRYIIIPTNIGFKPDHQLAITANNMMNYIRSFTNNLMITLYEDKRTYSSASTEQVVPTNETGTDTSI